MNNMHYIILLIVSSQVYSCDLSTCPFNQGQCIFGKCICNKEYTTVVNKNNTNCSYTKTKQKIFFFLEVIGFVGIGHIYAGRIFFGLIKLIFLWFYSIFCISFVIIFNGLAVDLKQTALFKKYLSGLLLILPLFLHGLDMYLIGFGYYNDGNSVELLYF